MKAANKAVYYNRPKSICVCGHSGDGPSSAHADSYYAPGHAYCLYGKCKCSQFTWDHFTPEFESYLNEADKGDK